MKLNISCIFPHGEERFHIRSLHLDVPLPAGWDLDHVDVDERALCPKHAPVRAWEDAVCGGCAGGWTDCSLWRAFAYKSWGLTNEQLETIRSGHCPFRTNGTFGVTFGNAGAQIEELDMSKRATPEAGQAMYDALLEWKAIYHPEEAR